MGAVVVIGASLGGFNAIRTLLSGLPPTFAVPIAIVQHRHKERDGLLVAGLRECSPLQLIEIEDKMPLAGGRVYLAPADYHTMVEDDHFALTIDPPVIHARPSIDVLFESAADVAGTTLIGVLLTGASHDGAAGMLAIKAAGGVTIVEDPASAECAVMPQAALNATTIDYVLPLNAIAPTLVALCGP
ncbi:MAG TPA: chemotaxis protein CheB [Herpetosiphonaceae bacterium]|nr:chemotaxis protein CheB [Herpetosiphonaceae bacterium]